MNPRQSRRSFVASLSLSLVTGCLGRSQKGAPELPANCPTTQNIDAEWPRSLDAKTVGSFVERYEYAYYRNEVVEYEPQSAVDAYEVSTSLHETPKAVDHGYEALVDSVGAVYRPTLLLQATIANPRTDVEVVSVTEVDDEQLENVLKRAVEEGDASYNVDTPGSEVDRYIASIASLSDDFDGPTEPGDSEAAYFRVEEETVELTVETTRFHADVGGTARYVVDEHTVWRAPSGRPDAEEGELLECRKRVSSEVGSSHALVCGDRQ